VLLAALGTGIAAGATTGTFNDPSKMDQARVLRRVSYALYLGECHTRGHSIEHLWRYQTDRWPINPGFECPDSRYSLDPSRRFARLGDEAIDDEMDVQGAHVVLHELARDHRIVSARKYHSVASMALS
jgi:hypothetical protein